MVRWTLQDTLAFLLLLSLLLPSLLIMFIPSTFKRPVSSWKALNLRKTLLMAEMAATETITSIILIKLIRVSLGTVRHPRRFKIVVIDIQITLKQMLSDFIGIRVNRAKKSGMVNITSSVNSRERSGINTILHELN